MSKSLMVAAPYVGDLVTGGVKLCGDIMAYRQATRQTELLRSTMHRQADAAMRQLAYEHALNMAELQQQSAQFGETLAHNRQNTADVMQLYADSHALLTALIARMCAPDVTLEQLACIKEVVATLQAEQSALIAEHQMLGRQVLSAFQHGHRSLREHEDIRTMTDVY